MARSFVCRPARTTAFGCWLKQHYWPLLSLALVTFCLYGPTVTYEFVNWDDPWYVLHNSLIVSWKPSNLWAIATQAAVKNYAPVTMFSYLIDHTLWGLWAGGYHLTNVAVHALNVVLVYVLILQLSQSRFVGWTTALLFAVHPVQIETVAWVSSRKGLLSATFALAALICWLRRDRTARDEGWGIFFFLLSLLAKAIAVALPAVVLTYDVLVRRQRLAVALPRQIIPGFIAIWLMLATMTAQSTEIGGVRTHMTMSKPHVLAVDAVILWQYVGMMLWPTNLCVLYDPPTADIAVQVAIAATAWILAAVVAWRLRRNNPYILLAMVASLAMLLPVINLIPISTLMNDRYLYLPCIPLFALAAAGLQKSELRFEEWRQWRAFAIEQPYGPSEARALRARAYAGVMLLGAAYAVAAASHLKVWASDAELWQHAMQHASRLPVVQIQYANSLMASGRTTEAVQVLQSTLAHGNPDALDRERIVEKLNDWQRTQ